MTIKINNYVFEKFPNVDDATVYSVTAEHPVSKRVERHRIAVTNASKPLETLGKWVKAWEADLAFTKNLVSSDH